MVHYGHRVVKNTGMSYGTLVRLHEDIEQTQLWGTSPTCLISLVGFRAHLTCGLYIWGQGLRESFSSVLCRIVGARSILSMSHEQQLSVRGYQESIQLSGAYATRQTS